VFARGLVELSQAKGQQYTDKFAVRKDGVKLFKMCLSYWFMVRFRV